MTPSDRPGRGTGSDESTPPRLLTVTSSARQRRPPARSARPRQRGTHVRIHHPQTSGIDTGAPLLHPARLPDRRLLGRPARTPAGAQSPDPAEDDPGGGPPTRPRPSAAP